MDKFRERLIFLHHFPHITWKTLYEILMKDPKLTFYKDYILSPTPSLNNFSYEIIQEQIHTYSQNEIQVITYFDEDYPPILKEIYQPPWILYAKGKVDLLKKGKKLAIVGARFSSEYGKKALETIMPELVAEKIVIVSGLALGVDTWAHQLAIRHSGQTIAVIAGGLYHIYPKENKELALKMMRSQLVLSEYPPHYYPERWHFPMRNRIISGLCQGTFVVEAKKRSGSLITANFALQEGREVFALPGSIFNPLSAGTNDLIQQGAKLVSNAKDIIEEIRPYDET